MASAAPTGDYGIDVHIDTGVLGIGSNWLSSVVQDVVVTPLWMALVWAVHALVVMLEWSFTIDLLPGATAGGLGRGLRQMEATLTQPWLPLSLAVASIVAAYNGLVRRRVAATVGDALLTVAMMAGALGVIGDPAGTVGAFGSWANQAALGTLAVAAQGAPARSERTFADGLDMIFSTAIEGPWCYLEFGDVGWCREPSRLDSRLRAAGLKLAAAELAQIGCAPDPLSGTHCVSAGSESAKTLAHSAELLRDAQSNGAIFLALPPNGPARNSINEQGSLLRTICQSTEATNCRGPAAAQAQFRTSPQTWSRLGGLLLISAGMLGMLLLLGSLALRLLAAALLSLLYLLLAPAIVLAPAFGEAGRGLFRKWGLQLLGTVVAKLLFSFLLGVVLALVSLIASLTTLGWWTQWLLMSTLWWGAYLRRHQVPGVAGQTPVSGAPPWRAQGRASKALGARGRRQLEHWAERRRTAKAASGTEPPAGAPRARPRTTSAPNERMPDSSAASPQRAREVNLRARPGGGGRSDLQAQLERVRHARDTASGAGLTRRAAELSVREHRIEQEIEQQPTLAGGTHGSPAPRSREGLSPPQAPAPGSDEERLRSHAFAAHSKRPDARADHGALSALAGYTRAEYDQLDPRKRREVRATIDRELASRRESRAGSTPGLRPPGPLVGRSRPSDVAPEPLRPEPAGGRAGESSVMRDAREVEAGRKRQLGLGRE